METSFLSKFLPSQLLEHFDIIKIEEVASSKEKPEHFQIHLSEKNKIVGDFDSNLYEPKDFLENIIQDFPLRGKAVFLHIKRRRWRLKSNHNIVIKNDLSYLITSGLTQELSAFLKERNR